MKFSLARFVSAPYPPAIQRDDAGEIEAKTHNVFVFDADGATAPETLRHKDRVIRMIWREALYLHTVSTEGDIRHRAMH